MAQALYPALLSSSWLIVAVVDFDSGLIHTLSIYLMLPGLTLILLPFSDQKGGQLGVAGKRDGGNQERAVSPKTNRTKPLPDSYLPFISHGLLQGLERITDQCLLGGRRDKGICNLPYHPNPH